MQGGGVNETLGRLYDDIRSGKHNKDFAIAALASGLGTCYFTRPDCTEVTREKNELSERVNTLQHHFDNAQHRIGELDIEIKKNEADTVEKKRLHGDVKKLNTTIEKLNEELAAAKRTAEDALDKYNQLRARDEGIAKSLVTARAERDGCNTEKKGETAKILQLQSEIAKLTAEHNECAEQLKKLETEKQSPEAVEALKSLQDDDKKRLVISNKENRELKRQIVDFETEKQALNAQIIELKNRLDGFIKAKKYAKQEDVKADQLELDRIKHDLALANGNVERCRAALERKNTEINELEFKHDEEIRTLTEQLTGADKSDENMEKLRELLKEKKDVRIEINRLKSELEGFRALTSELQKVITEIAEISNKNPETYEDILKVIKKAAEQSGGEDNSQFIVAILVIIIILLFVLIGLYYKFSHQSEGLRVLDYGIYSGPPKIKF